MRLDRGGLVALGILFIAIVVLIYLYSRALPTAPESQVTASKTISVQFVCPQGKSIGAIFEDNSVKLKLSDGREFTLPHAVSADGARFANADESFVFWNKGNGAFITEGGTTTYNDCTASGPHD